jgi:branched-chain amino acid transport system substrate-binding protein
MLSIALMYAFAVTSSAQAPRPIKIGVLADMSSVYAEAGGKGSVAAVEMAVEDAGGKALGQPVQVVSADFQLKTDVALGIAGQWFDRDGVDAIFDVANSGTAIAVNNLAKEKRKLVFVGSAAADPLGGTECNGYGLGWLYTVSSVVKTVVAAQLATGRDTWFLLLPDTAYGNLMDGAIRKELAASGGKGKVVGSVRFPNETTDFSSFLLQAQASGAKLIVQTVAGSANVATMKQAKQFGLPNEKQAIGGMIDIITDVKGAGVDVMQGQTFGTSFYWDYDAKSRAFADRYFAKTGKRPTNQQAADYSAVMSYIKAVNATGSRDPEKVTAYLQKQKIDDAVVRNGTLRKGGRLVHDMYLVQVKKPSESKGEWDYYKVLETVPAEKAFGPIADSACAMDK